jgi:hypothetical protein
MFSQKHFSSKIALSGAAAAAIDSKRLTVTTAQTAFLNRLGLAIVFCSAPFGLLGTDKRASDAGASDMGASDADASDAGDPDAGTSDAGDPDMGF